jgi:CubicO group peptidase (beta-lactamase class C family)
MLVVQRRQRRLGVGDGGGRRPRAERGNGRTGDTMLHRRATLSLIAGVAALGGGAAPRLAAAQAPAAAQDPAARAASALPRAARQEEVGLSAERLDSITGWLRAEVEAGRIPGAVVAIGRGGRLAYHEAVGFRDRDAGAPMAPDAIFRIASLTKPFTSLAALILVEEARLMLWHPVSRYLPEFREQAVGMERAPARRGMTVLDLLRHTSGLTYGALPVAGGAAVDPVQQSYGEAKVNDPDQTLAEFTAKLARQPLRFQPGTHWEYSHSTDVLGRVVEVVSGMDLDRFVRERISRPLGLADTGFWIPAEAAGRAAKAQVDPATGRRMDISDALERPRLFSGGGGMAGPAGNAAMVSTAMDYALFCQMLLNGGHLGAARVASRKTVELMTADHLPPDVRFGPGLFPLFGGLAPAPETGYGFGLGVAVRTHQGRSPVPGSVGDYHWGGATGTYFWVDPREELFAVVMMQGPSDRLQYRYAMRQLVYQALA